MKWDLCRNDVKNPLAKMSRENSGLLNFQDYLVLKPYFNRKSFLWHHSNPLPAISNTIFLLLLLFFMIAFNIFYFEQLSDKNNNKITISAERKLRKHENENCWKENFASRWQRNKVREWRRVITWNFSGLWGRNKTRWFYLRNFSPRHQFCW